MGKARLPPHSLELRARAVANRIAHAFSIGPSLGTFKRGLAQERGKVPGNAEKIPTVASTLFPAHGGARSFRLQNNIVRRAL